MLEHLLAEIKKHGISAGISRYRLDGCPLAIVKAIYGLADTIVPDISNVDLYEYIVDSKMLNTVNWRIAYRFPLQSWEWKFDHRRN